MCESDQCQINETRYKSMCMRGNSLYHSPVRRIWMFVGTIKPHIGSTALTSTNRELLCNCCLSTSTTLLPLLHRPASIIIPFLWASRSPLVRLMDDSSGREWQCSNHLGISVILIWVPRTSGSAEERLGHILTWVRSADTWTRSKR